MCHYTELIDRTVGSKMVKRLRRRKYGIMILERTIGLVFGPFSALYRSFLERCILTSKAVGLYDMTCPNLLRGDKALIIIPSDCFRRGWLLSSVSKRRIIYIFSVCLFYHTAFVVSGKVWIP